MESPIGESQSTSYSVLFKSFIVVGLLIAPMAALFGSALSGCAIYSAAPWYIIMICAKRMNEFQRVNAAATILVVQIVFISICWTLITPNRHSANIGLGLLAICLPIFYFVAVNFTVFMMLLITSYLKTRTRSQ